MEPRAGPLCLLCPLSSSPGAPPGECAPRTAVKMKVGSGEEGDELRGTSEWPAYPIAPCPAGPPPTPGPHPRHGPPGFQAHFRPAPPSPGPQIPRSAGCEPESRLPAPAGSAAAASPHLHHGHNGAPLPWSDLCVENTPRLGRKAVGSSVACFPAQPEGDEMYYHGLPSLQNRV